MSSSSSLSPSFDPHAVHFFTSASSTPASSLTSQGLPIAAYPAHVVAASTTNNSSHAQPPNSSPASQRSALGLSLTTQTSPPTSVQSPQPRYPAQTRGFDLGGTSAVKGQKAQKNNAIFEPFKHERTNTPDLDQVIKKKSGQWNQWELEQSLKGN
jgi:hypothetical protein